MKQTHWRKTKVRHSHFTEFKGHLYLFITADEHHLSELLANCDLLLEISGRLEGSSLQGVVRGWSDLYTLLADDLATKHSLHLADYRQSKGEGHVGVVTSLQATPEEVCLYLEHTDHHRSTYMSICGGQCVLIDAHF